MNNPSNELVPIDRLQKIASWREKYGIGHNVMIPAEEAELMVRELLAYREAAKEPVVIVEESDYLTAAQMTGKEPRQKAVRELYEGALIVGSKLYAAPQLPALPDVLPCPVKLEPGLILGKGVRTQTLLDALVRREKYYAELEAMTPEQRAEHDNALSDIRKMFGNSEQVNSPVIPDGWTVVPINPTENMIIEGFESEPDEFFSEEKTWEAYQAMSGCEQVAHRARLCWAAMLAAAPKPNSET